MTEGDASFALRLLDEIRAENYPKALLRPLLASCHPGLDESFLDLDLVPSCLLIAPLLPGALAGLPLDARRLFLTHGCDPREFVTDYLNDVLRGERPLYNDLPALDIHTYCQLVQLSPARSGWLKRHTALECLAFEVISGIQSEATALRRWRSSHHDALLEQPWIWIQPSKDLLRSDLQSVVSAPHGIQMVTNSEEATVLIHQATDYLLNGGATYLLWNSTDEPPTGWISVLRGLQQQRTMPFQQIGETRHGLQEIRPLRFSKERSLLAIDAAWFARRNPQQVLSFFRHWLNGPISKSRKPTSIDLQAQRLPLIRPSICEGVLVLSVTDQQIQEFGKANLKHRVIQRALEGGFHTGIVLELESNSGLTIRHQLETLVSANTQGTQIASFIGAEDLVAPDSWDYLARYLSIKGDVLLCSDEELQWSQDPVRIGQRQFAGQPTPYRAITRGHLPGLVAVDVALIMSLDLKERYHSLHGFIKDIGLQWMARNSEIKMVPQALLRRHLESNPTVLNISTCNQRNPFTPVQLKELDDITKTRASSWLHSEGSIFRGKRAGSYDL